MTMRHIARLTSLAVALSAVACTSAAVDPKAAHEAGDGTARVFDATPQELWVASHAAVKWNPVGGIRDHQTEHYFVTNPGDFDQVGVWVEPADPGTTRVSVVVIDDPYLPGPNEQGLLNDIGKALTLERNGLPMDKRP